MQLTRSPWQLYLFAGGLLLLPIYADDIFTSPQKTDTHPTPSSGQDFRHQSGTSHYSTRSHGNNLASYKHFTQQFFTWRTEPLRDTRPLLQNILYQPPSENSRDVEQITSQLMQLKRQRPKNNDDFRKQHQAIRSLCEQAMRAIRDRASQDVESDSYFQFERDWLLSSAILIDWSQSTESTTRDEERTKIEALLQRWNDYATRRKTLDLVDLRLINQMAKNFETYGEPLNAALAYEYFLKAFSSTTSQELPNSPSRRKFAIAPDNQSSYQELETIFEGTIRRLRLRGQPLILSGKTFDGQSFDLTSYRGKVVLVDYWATWCGPCVAEYPQIRKLWEKYHHQGFEVVGVSMDADRESLAKYIQERSVPWIILNDQQAGGKHPSTEYYSIQTVPAMFLIGRDGNVITTKVEVSKLEALLQESLPLHE